MLGAWRARRAGRRQQHELAEAEEAGRVRERTEAVLETVVGPLAERGVATIERSDHDDSVVGPDIRVTPAREGAAPIIVTPMLAWVSFAVGTGDLEIWVDPEGRWEEELSVYLGSVVEGRYSEIGKAEGRFSASTKMIFGQPQGEDMTTVVGGAYRGVEHDHPPGERTFVAYEGDRD